MSNNLSSISLIINGNHRSFLLPKFTVLELFHSLMLDPEVYVVELNGDILPAPFGDQKLRENDRVEIVQFMGGGGSSFRYSD